MKKNMYTFCGFMYDPEKGYLNSVISPGTLNDDELISAKETGKSLGKYILREKA